MEKLDWEDFKTQFHPSWHSKMQEIIESPELWNIFQVLKEKSREGVILTPKSDDLFSSFQIDLNNLKVVVMGMDVYPQVRNNTFYSNGIAIDCRNYGKVSPSLEKLYNGIEADICNGFNLDFNKKNVSLQYLIDQGVMLTNVGLVTEKDKSGKLIDLFKPFWKQVFEKIFSVHNGLIFLALGKDAEKVINQYSTPFIHWVIGVEHPVASSYQQRDWKHEKCFSKINSILSSNNGKEEVINWTNIKKEEVPF